MKNQSIDDDAKRKKIGDNIKKIRETKNIAREVIAAQIGMEVSGYGKIERGECDLTILKLYKIAEILEVHVSQILESDASQVFNISNNHLVQGSGAKAENMQFHGDAHKDKYIKMLEEDNARQKTENEALKAEIKRLKQL